MKWIIEELGYIFGVIETCQDKEKAWSIIIDRLLKIKERIYRNN